MFTRINFVDFMDLDLFGLTLVLRRGVATTPSPNSFCPGAQKHAAKGKNISEHL